MKVPNKLQIIRTLDINKPCFCSNKLRWDSSKTLENKWKRWIQSFNYRNTNKKLYGQIDTLTKLLGQMSHRQNGIPLFNVTLTQRKALYLNRHIINTLTNVTRTNVTQTNCHLDKILPFRCHNQVSSVTSIFSSGQMSPGQMSLGQMSPGQILPYQPCSTAQLDHQKHLSSFLLLVVKKLIENI